MPEIGGGATFFLSVIALIGGIIIGTQSSLWIQAILLIAVITLNNSWAVKELEIGSIAYLIISFVFIIGLAIGDISYFFQVGVAVNPDFTISNPFKAK